MKRILDIFCKYFKEYITRKNKNISNKIEVSTKEEIAEISYLSRNADTFRIIYTSNNKIVSHEVLSVKKLKLDYCKKLTLKIIEKMYLLSADGYYIVKNNSKLNINSLILVMKLFRNIKGFKGYLAINSIKYSFIEATKNNKIKIKNNIEIINYSLESVNKIMEKSPTLNLKINSKNDLAKIIVYLNNILKFSTLIIVDDHNRIKSIQDINNKLMNLRKEQIEGYIINRLKENKGNKVLFATTDENVFTKTLDLVNAEIINESVAYNSLGDKIYIYNYERYERKN